jgi:transposase
MTQATILAGAERRRRWSTVEKTRIVEESLARGARVTEVARRHDVHPNLLHLWRRQARAGALGDAGGGPRFLPVAIAAEPRAAVVGVATSAAGVEPVVEVVLRNGRVLRLPEEVTPGRAGALADALEGP